MSALLTLTRVSKTFENGTRALERVDLSVNPGEFVSLVGPSGCGKSTVLRLIAGLILPDEGAVFFPGGRPEIGFVLQEPTLMPWARALDNARLPLDLEGMDRARADERAARALARVGLAGFERAFPRELSGGMRMRVSVARAIASGPKLLLMDEPFAALDEFTRQALNDDLLKLWAEGPANGDLCDAFRFRERLPVFARGCHDTTPGPDCSGSRPQQSARPRLRIPSGSGICCRGTADHDELAGLMGTSHEQVMEMVHSFRVGLWC
jgi:NitT/TauT family transport system ATP-binding protein